MKVNKYIHMLTLVSISIMATTATTALHAASPFGNFSSKQSLSYAGTWLNSTFSSTDSYSVTVTLDGNDFSITTTIQGNVYGYGISVPLTFQGTMDEDRVTNFNTSFPTYGEVAATLDFSSAPATLTATSTPGSEAPGIAPSTGTATFDFLSYDATFQVNFNGGGDAVGTSNATLVEQSPAIISTSGDVSINSGEATTLTVNAIGSLIRIQWYEGTTGDTSAPVNGADDYQYTTPALTTSASYWARVTNHAGEAVDSSTFTISINPSVSIWVPSGWLFHSWPYAYSVDEGRWHYFDPAGAQWRVNISTGEWGTMPSDSGWYYFNWPYAYSSDSATWYWYDASSEQWVLDLSSGIWSPFGE